MHKDGQNTIGIFSCFATVPDGVAGGGGHFVYKELSSLVGGRCSPEVAFDHWFASSNPLLGMFRH